MTARSPALAKLTRPKVFDAIDRPRLFALLDEAAKRPIVWVSAPPGAGKTTLVASYLEARGLRHLWYQIDVGDADPATFVHYMRAAALQIARRKGALPLFPPEPQQDLARFSRAFFRDLFAILPHPCVVVLDNFHEARPTPEQRVALAQGLEEIPDGITLLVVSRTDPPPEFARLVAGRRISRVDEVALRCTPEEAEAILGGPSLDARVVRRIQRQSEGWVAALVLLREHVRHRDAPLDDPLGEGKEAIFQYFAGEIFGRARPANQRMLMLTALAPSITQAEAVALTGDEEAPRLLEYLYRRHLFLDRRRGASTTYQYHALFREFLLEELRRRLPRDEQRAARAQAAALLAARGLVAEALELHREGGQWNAMGALIRAHALDWARQGRAQMLSDWIEALPRDVRDRDPWLGYWHGRAWLFLEPQRGRPAVEHAFAAFRAADDRRGQALALGAIVTSYYYEWADFRPIDPWVPEFDRLLGEEQAGALDPHSELRARAAQLIALLFRRPDEGELQRAAARLDALVDGEPDPSARVMAASILLNTYNWLGVREAADGLVARMQPVIATAEVAPLMQVWWRTHLSFWHYVAGRYEASNAVNTQAREIAERYGLEGHLFEIDHAQASALVARGELAQAQALVAAMEQRLSPARRMDLAYFHFLRSMLAQRLGQGALAVGEAERAIALGRETGLPTMQMPHFLARLAQSRSTTGDREGATRALDEAVALAAGAERLSFERQRELVQIDDDIDAARTQRAAQRLRAMLSGYRERGQTVLLRSNPDLTARLADFALAHGIETDFVRSVIERNGLVAPPGAGAAWPFRVRVRVLGGFELQRDGQPVRSPGKAQQRPLDLLKLVVALGGEHVDSQQVTASLWPDADGGAAKTSFDTALFRLRKLLDVENAIVLAGGKLTLAPSLVWTDVRALAAALDAAHAVVEGRAAGALPDRPSDERVARAAGRLLDAYPGALLGDDETAWIAKPRDMLRARFTRALSRLGEHLERRADWTAAVELYRRGLEADNLAESFHRGLMRALAASGDQAEALNAYRRCRELLSIVLGIKPSAETERLHREIAAGQGVRGGA